MKRVALALIAAFAVSTSTLSAGLGQVPDKNVTKIVKQGNTTIVIFGRDMRESNGSLNLKKLEKLLDSFIKEKDE